MSIKDGHEEAEEELPKKAKFFFSTAVQKWDADFYVKVDDNIDIDLGTCISIIIALLKLMAVPSLWCLG